MEGEPRSEVQVRIKGSKQASTVYIIELCPKLKEWRSRDLDNQEESTERHTVDEHFETCVCGSK